MAILQDNKIVNVEQVSLVFDASVLVFGIHLPYILSPQNQAMPHGTYIHKSNIFWLNWGSILSQMLMVSEH